MSIKITFRTLHLYSFYKGYFSSEHYREQVLSTIRLLMFAHKSFPIKMQDISKWSFNSSIQMSVNRIFIYILLFIIHLFLRIIDYNSPFINRWYYLSFVFKFNHSIFYQCQFEEIRINAAIN